MQSIGANACVPIAIAILRDKDAKDVNDLLIERRLRSKDRPMTYPNAKVAFKLYGIDLDRDCTADFKGKTVRTVAREMPVGKRYLVMTNSHAVSVVDGKIEDWSEDRQLRVHRIVEVTQ